MRTRMKLETVIVVMMTGEFSDILKELEADE